MKKIIITVFMALAAAFVCMAAAAAAEVKPVVYTGKKSEITATYANEGGYISVKMTEKSEVRIKVQVIKGDMTYNYDLNKDGTAETYPLQMGDGDYIIKVMQNTTGSKYAAIQTQTITVKLKSEKVPFLNPNQQVNYNDKSQVVAKAKELVKNKKTELDKLDAIYKYIIDLLAYDTAKAKTVQSGYVTDVDSIMKDKKGICLDYSAVMAAMLRSVGIPTKLVTGYVAPNGAYHAWNESYITGIGWVTTGKLYFDGKNWSRMDATFMSSGKSSKKITDFIGDGSSYSTKYIY